MFKMNEKYFWNNSPYKYKRCGSSFANFGLWRMALNGDGEAGRAEDECAVMLEQVQDMEDYI